MVCCTMSLAAATREAPRPLAAHPGNVFLADEEVTIAGTAASGSWTVVDYSERVLAEGQGAVRLGKLPVGYYEVRQGTNRISVAVLAPLKTAPAPDSPLGVDVAMAWFYTPERMTGAANLCALAGMNWVRDRLNWGEMEPKRGEFRTVTKYDASAKAQTEAGLRVLQVNHVSPSWANPEPSRMPADLRDAYRFYREMAGRWKGSVSAFEPWNEADNEPFGAHIGSEMASFQKACYFGLKAGNPDGLVCQNVFTLPRAAVLDDFRQNEVAPYFDTFNLHHYCAFDDYPALYAKYRAVAAGKPLWVTECALPVEWADAATKEMTPIRAREQSVRVTKTYACSLHEGSAATFFFMLPHYSEQHTQYGLMRADGTPRPAYVALAAVGRLLAGAKPLGRIRSADPAVRAFLFRTMFDGAAHEVLVAWTTGGVDPLTLPVQPSRIFDHLGREVPEAGLSDAPKYLVFEPGTARALPLIAPPQPPPLAQNGSPCPIVFQAVHPKERTTLEQSAYRIMAGQAEDISLFVYNFGPNRVHGVLRVDGPMGWQIECPSELDVGPDDRVPFTLKVKGVGGIGVVRLRGEFAGTGEAVLSLRLMSDPNVPVPTEGK